MKLAIERDASRDGRLVLGSRDLTRAALAIIGSNLVSHHDDRKVGSSLTTERRGIGVIDPGEAPAGLIMFGDKVRAETRLPDDPLPFGAIHQRGGKA